MQDCRRLLVWQKADTLALNVIAELSAANCRVIPGLRAQAIRAACAIADLLAEGCGQESRLQLARYVDMALGSSAELRNQLSRAHRAGIITEESHRRLDGEIDEVRRMLTGLVRAVRRQPGKDAKVEPARGSDRELRLRPARAA